ncbi:hypothetical protein HU200_046372 [Digitaria exilis]|uniref:DUF4220 domain-containing protein n=1 Tax=Digitaria exilis TaxID=1010633 RepID=A0A835EEU8_9POAL|nr:hypothetical protein HU200_046371 [Digitaria exilis]KAF8677889.1 hypothetical protein HU200_046372 [Digitaria exilis]
MDRGGHAPPWTTAADKPAFVSAAATPLPRLIPASIVERMGIPIMRPCQLRGKCRPRPLVQDTSSLGVRWVGGERPAAPSAALTLCDSDVPEDEKQVVALWAAFLLLHLGDPDNLTAYAQEDNKLSTRKWFEMIGHFVGVGYAIYKYTYRGGGGGPSRVLFAASVVVSGTGEDASSSEGSRSKKKREDCHRCHSIDGKMDQLRYRIGKLQWKLCDREALLLAQDLFPIWRHAMVDSSVILPDSGRHLASKEILRLEWGSMCKVAEMELSLMYEVLYTKAIVAHSFKGWYYLTRFLLPLCTAAAALLFWLHRQHQQQGKIRGSFVGITYALLLIDFLLDLAWLLRALGSTWAYAYMQTQAPAWLRHQVICPGSWHYLHHLVVRVDPMSWLLCRDPINYRTTTCCASVLLLVTAYGPTWLETKEMLYLSELHGKVKELLFQRVQAILLEAIETDDHDTAECYSMEDIRSKWGEKAFDLRNPEGRRIDLFPELDIHDVVAPKFGKEFEEDVLVWHIATCMKLDIYDTTDTTQEVHKQRLLSMFKGPAPDEAVEAMEELLSDVNTEVPKMLGLPAAV